MNIFQKENSPIQSMLTGMTYRMNHLKKLGNDLKSWLKELWDRYGIP